MPGRGCGCRPGERFWALETNWLANMDMLGWRPDGGAGREASNSRGKVTPMQIFGTENYAHFMPKLKGTLTIVSKKKYSSPHI